jgi:dolichol-phosphate mannosyltransferase
VRSLFFCPVFNEIRDFPALLAELRSQPLACDELLLINNGSRDGSEQLVREAGFPFLDLPRNLGVGGATIVAIDWALERGFDVLGGLAANGKMAPDEMSRLLDPIRAGEADYVTGSRFRSGGRSPNLPAFRRASIPLVNLWVRALTGVRLTDATCGYRAYRLDLLRRAEFDWHAEWLHTYAMEYYFFAKVLLDRRVRWREVPISMRYPERRRAYSKIRPGRDWWAMLKPWLVARLDGKGFR